MSQNVHLLALAGPELGVSQGLGPVSSSRRDLPFNMSPEEKSPWAAHRRAVRPRSPFAPHGGRRWVKSLSRAVPWCWSRSPRDRQAVLHRSLHARITAFFSRINDFLATRRRAGAAPILLVVKVPQHFLGSSGSVEKSGFYFADHYQKQRNGCFCLKSKVSAGCSGAQAAAGTGAVLVLGLHWGRDGSRDGWW